MWGRSSQLNNYIFFLKSLIWPFDIWFRKMSDYWACGSREGACIVCTILLASHSHRDRGTKLRWPCQQVKWEGNRSWAEFGVMYCSVIHTQTHEILRTCRNKTEQTPSACRLVGLIVGNCKARATYWKLFPPKSPFGFLAPYPKKLHVQFSGDKILHTYLFSFPYLINGNACH